LASQTTHRQQFYGDGPLTNIPKVKLSGSTKQQYCSMPMFLQAAIEVMQIPSLLPIFVHYGFREVLAISAEDGTAEDHISSDKLN
jgi:hypothetical protein